MTAIQNKIDFAAVVYVEGANPNGDPLNGNRPRTMVDGYGEISDVCVKRKLRNRLQDEGQKIFVQSAERADDGKKSLKDRAEPVIKNAGKDVDKLIKDCCAEWYDVRAFGQLLAFKLEKGTGVDGVSIGIRGPVSIRPALSVVPVSITSTQITKSVNSETKDKKGSDTMGMKYRVDSGVYVVRGSINPQLAEKTGFSDEDAEALKYALRTLFVNDSSSARPDGSMDVLRVIWWKHNSKIGQYSTAKVHNSLKVVPKVECPRCADDYEIVIEPLTGLEPEIYC